MVGGRPKRAFCFELAARRTVGTLGQFAPSPGGVGASSQDHLAWKNVPKSFDTYFIADNYGKHLTPKSKAGSQHSRDSTYALRPMALTQPGGSTGLRNKSFLAGRSQQTGRENRSSSSEC
jgi:hypothetical protein